MGTAPSLAASGSPAKVKVSKSASAKKAAKRKTARKSSRKRVTLTAQRKREANAATRRLSARYAKRPVSSKARHVQQVAISRPAPRSVGEVSGLRSGDDSLDLSSSVALVLDQDTNEVLFSKNDSAVLPIASLTKLMTGLVIAESDLDMRQRIRITRADVDTYKGSRSRLAVGARLTRGEMLHLALMSSENRAAHALGRTYPGGMRAFVRRMNEKARQLGMYDTRYVEPTGLRSQNKSSARDLATLVSAAYQHPVLRKLSTDPSHQVSVGRRTLKYVNSNRLVRGSDWDIGLQKTGYISEAGRCLVMQANVASRRIIMVFLDSSGKRARIQDAQRVRRYVESLPLPVQANAGRVQS
ncbi:serine hydrolase [Hydrogenophaga sp. 5NK40-0174]|uniref:D-alanyl-D-alanine carboxypeptidase family protein n=1 Tax=Hydrogenophaga sp. 5NK40-0174 TaxID=3127649 RepID=UPI00333F5052